MKAKQFFERLKVNAWRLLTFAIAVYALIVIGSTGVTVVRTVAEISRLSAECDRYAAAIERDSIFLEKLNNDASLEKYAREYFYMQREGEQVYIVE